MTRPTGPRLSRAYMLTNGRTRPQGDLAATDHVTRTELGSRTLPTLRSTHAAIIEACALPLTVTQLAARLGLPVGSALVLADDLIGDHLLRVAAAPRTIDLADAAAPITAAPDTAAAEAAIGRPRR